MTFVKKNLFFFTCLVIIIVWQLSFLNLKLHPEYTIYNTGYKGFGITYILLHIPHRIFLESIPYQIFLSNQILWIFSLMMIFTSLWFCQQRLFSIILILIVGSNPYQLNEVYAREDIFCWILSVGLIVTAFFIPLLTKKFNRNTNYLLCICTLTGMLLGLARIFRQDPLGIVISVVCFLILTKQFNKKHKLIAMLLLCAGMKTLCYLPNAVSYINTGNWSYYEWDYFQKFEGSFFPIYGGVGDFDEKYSIVWDDLVMHEKARKLYHDSVQVNDSDEHSPGFNDPLIKELIYHIFTDPLWYLDILAHRICRVMFENVPIGISLSNSFWILLPKGFVTFGCLLFFLAGTIYFKEYFYLKLSAFTVFIGTTPLLIFSGANNHFYFITNHFIVSICIIFLFKIIVKSTKKLQRNKLLKASLPLLMLGSTLHASGLNLKLKSIDYSLKNNNQEEYLHYGQHPRLPTPLYNFHELSKTMVLSQSDNNIIIWDFNSNNGPKLLTITSTISSLCISPNASLLAVGTRGRELLIYNLKTLSLLKHFKGLPWHVEATAFSKNEDILASGSYDEIRLFNTKTLIEIKRWKGHDFGIKSVVFDPRDDSILSTGADQTIKKWNKRGEYQHLFSGNISKTRNSWDDIKFFFTGHVNKQQRAHGGIIHHLALSKNSKYLLSGSSSTVGDFFSYKDESLRLWDVVLNKEVSAWDHPFSVNSFKFLNDSKYFMFAGYSTWGSAFPALVKVNIEKLTVDKAALIGNLFIKYIETYDSDSIILGSKQGVVVLFDHVNFSVKNYLLSHGKMWMIINSNMEYQCSSDKDKEKLIKKFMININLKKTNQIFKLQPEFVGD